jgi:photosystem II stability/assembly factor-like uncharacterized protein
MTMPDYDDLTQEERALLPLIAYLQQIYNTQVQDEQDLRAIGEQLAHARLQLLTPLGAQASPPIEREDLGRILPAFVPSSQRQRREFRALKVLAATLVVGLLTGSLVITLLLARSHHSTGSTPSIQPVSPCPASTAALPMYVSSIHMGSQTTGWGVIEGTRKVQNVVVNLPGETRLLHTIDSGCHWKIVKTFSFPAPVITTPFFLSETTVWIASENHLVHTADAGKTWQTDDLSLAAGESAVIRDLTFLDNNTGWLIAEIMAASAPPKSGPAAVLFHTSDGGHHWSQLLRVSPENISTSPWNAGSRLSFLTATTGWMTGDSLLQTLDGGKTWHPQPLPPPPGVTSLSGCQLDPPRFFSARDGILPASCNGAHPGFLTLVTHDGGQSWQSQPFVAVNYNEVARRLAPPGSGSFAISLLTPSPSFTDMQFGWVGYPRLEEFTTRDGGKHWQRLDLSMLPKGVGPLEFANKDVGWALIGSDALTSQLYRTIDGGKTWTPLALSVT